MLHKATDEPTTTRTELKKWERKQLYGCTLGWQLLYTYTAVVRVITRTHNREVGGGNALYTL